MVPCCHLLWAKVVPFMKHGAIANGRRNLGEDDSLTYKF